MDAIGRWWDRRNPLPYILPLVLYTFLAVSPEGLTPGELAVRFVLQTLVAGVALLAAWPVYPSLNWRVPLITLPVAIAGGVLWIVLATGAYEWRLLETVGVTSLQQKVARPQFNPNQTFDGSALYVVFLAARAIGLVAVVPLAEELFLRGFVLRYIGSPQWSERNVGDLTRWSWLAVVVYAIASHPAEPLAAAVWFTLVTALAWRTRSFAACLVAHSVANAMLLVYVLAWEDWRLW